jgi:hypothetical protein
MTIEPVVDKKGADLFFKLPLQFYKRNKFWIRPLDKDVRSVFDIHKNPVAKKDNFMRWIIRDERQNPIGCIAAFVNPKTVNKNTDYPVGGIGFFECNNNQQAANLLFDTAKDWLQKQGVEAMEGPINFGDRDKWWGLLTKGFDQEPNYLANYQLPYYQQLFENYGFKLYFNQFTFKRDIHLKLPEVYIETAQEVLNNPNYKFEHIKKNNLDKYTDDFRIIYNKAWTGHLGVSEMKQRQAKAIINSLKPVLDEKVAWFGYYKDEPIAFFISIPEVNQVFKHINGKLNLWGKLIFIKQKIFKTNKKLLGIIFGVTPEFDGKGVTHAITHIVRKTMEEDTNYRHFEMHGIGDFNPAMIKLVTKFKGSEKSKIHTTYRYLFDRKRPYKRMPIKTKKNA